MTFVIISGEIDLSVGAQLALAGVVAASAMQATGGQLMAGVIAGLLLGAVVGLANGLMTTGLGIPSFLVTLATLGICRGLSLLISGGQPVLANNSWFWAAFNTASTSGSPFGVVDGPGPAAGGASCTSTPSAARCTRWAATGRPRTIPGSGSTGSRSSPSC